MALEMWPCLFSVSALKPQAVHMTIGAITNSLTYPDTALRASYWPILSKLCQEPIAFLQGEKTLSLFLHFSKVLWIQGGWSYPTLPDGLIWPLQSYMFYNHHKIISIFVLCTSAILTIRPFHLSQRYYIESCYTSAMSPGNRYFLVFDIVIYTAPSIS